MADFGNMSEETVPTVEEITAMKVADLRKKLKAFGLPITGNKTELVERLQEFCISSKGIDTFDSTHLSFDDSHVSELENADDQAGNEDNSVLDKVYSSFMDSQLETDSKVLASSENKLNINTNSNSLTKPLKKRSIVTTEPSVSPKKLVLNRTNVHTQITMKPTPTIKHEEVVMGDKNVEKKVVTLKTLSAAERMAMRAKRFNMTNTISTLSTAKTKTPSTIVRNSKQSVISSSVAPDLQVLKKRAERFGQNVSTVLKQLEQKEKLLKRKCKFGASVASVASSGDEQTKKKSRAERFGLE